MLPNPPGGLVPSTALIPVTFDIPVSYFSLVSLRLWEIFSVYTVQLKYFQWQKNVHWKCPNLVRSIHFAPQNQTTLSKYFKYDSQGQDAVFKTVRTDRCRFVSLSGGCWDPNKRQVVSIYFHGLQVLITFESLRYISTIFRHTNHLQRRSSVNWSVFFLFVSFYLFSFFLRFAF